MDEMNQSGQFTPPEPEPEIVLDLDVETLSDPKSEMNPKLSRIIERVKEQKESISAHTKHTSHHSHSKYSSGPW